MNKWLVIGIAVLALLWFSKRRGGGGTGGGGTGSGGGGGIVTPCGAGYTLMSHPTQGQTCIPNDLVSVFAKPIGEWTVV